MLASVALLATMMLAGCSLTGPDLRGNLYVLRSVNDQPLPTTAFDRGTFRMVVIADTIVLHDDGTGMRTTVGDTYSKGEVGAPPVEPVRERIVVDLRWSMVLDRFEATFICPPNAMCIAGPHLVGGLDGDGLVLETDLGRLVPTEYARRL